MARGWRRAARSALGVTVGAIALLATPAGALGTDGSLGFLESDVNGIDGVDGLKNATAVAISPDGQSAYVTSCGDAAVATFSRDPATGALTFIAAAKDGVGGVTGMLCPADVAVSPDGKNVYVASTDSGAVAVFARDPASGGLTFVEAETGGSPPLPSGVAISPNGAQVYLTASGSNGGPGGVFTYNRDAASGALTFAAANTVDGASSVALSPDGRSAYVTSSGDNALATFTRDTTTGALTPAGVLHDGVGGVDGLAQASSAAVSGDGANVYVTAFVDSSVATFARDSTTGALSFAGIAHDDLGGALDLAVSPDGANVYAVAFLNRALVTFSRNATTGALTFVGAATKADHGDDGLNGPWGIGTSPDNKNVYVAALNGDSVSTFVRNPGPLTPTLSAKKRQTAALTANAECSLGCDYVDKVKVKIGKTKVKSRDGGTLYGLTPTTLTFGLTKQQLKLMARALKHDKGTATLTFKARAGSEETSATATVKLKR